MHTVHKTKRKKTNPLAEQNKWKKKVDDLETKIVLLSGGDSQQVLENIQHVH